jgi:drug/metabolite transporter (DMT)-like permease
VDLKQLTRGDRIAGVSGILLVIVLLALPWHIVDEGVSPLGEDLGERWIAAVEPPNGLWAWLAIVLVVFMIVMIVLDRIVGAEELPLPLTYYQLTLVLAVLAGLCLLMKLWRERTDLGWGAALAVVLCGAMIYGASLVYQAAGEGRELEDY